MKEWQKKHSPALLGSNLTDERVQCGLSPRKCKLKDGQRGYCGVRGNVDGKLVSFNYGKSVQAAVETIETEAVNHFLPGTQILSLGNIGCMMNCVYCHNWKTSQSKQVSDIDVHNYSPDDIIEIALANKIKVISWTYNDPVVWHEFVLDVSRMAKKHGIYTLYKSAFYITPEAVTDLLPVIDIFSISLKSVSDEHYKKYTGGRVEPVLSAIKQVYAAGKHLEISSLMVTGISDSLESTGQIAKWIVDELDVDVPFHLVRFHPDYKFRDRERTSVQMMHDARVNALQTGLKNVYLGNIFDHESSSTKCQNCDNILIYRYGLHSRVQGLGNDSCCSECGHNSKIVLSGLSSEKPLKIEKLKEKDNVFRFDWSEAVNALHVFPTSTGLNSEFFMRRILQSGNTNYEAHKFSSVHALRRLFTRSDPDETGIEFSYNEGVDLDFHEVFDRAHFPTVSLREAGSKKLSPSPLPLYPGSQKPKGA